MRRRLLVLAALVLGASALAQERWAVQVVALRDFREAQATTADLMTLGFDAYTEFAMLDNQQWVRVRVGCYTTREAADAMADALRARITAQAQAVAFSPGTPVPGCTEEVIGFLADYQWQLVDDNGPVRFEVVVAGVPASVAHDGSRWRVAQQGDGEPELAAVESSAVAFQERRVAGLDFVTAPDPAGTSDTGVVVCPGRLLASVADVAIVQRGDLVLACRFAGQAGEVVSR